MNDSRKASVAALMTDMRFVLAVTSKSLCERSADGRRLPLQYVDGWRIENPEEPIGSWRRKPGGRKSAVWLNSVDEHSTFLVPRSIDAALSVLAERPQSMILLDTHRPVFFEPLFWFTAARAAELAAAPDGYGPNYWSRYACRRFHPAANAPGMLLEGPVAAEVTKLSREIASATCADHVTTVVPERVALKAEWVTGLRAVAA